MRRQTFTLGKRLWLRDQTLWGLIITWVTVMGGKVMISPILLNRQVWSEQSRTLFHHQ